MNPNDLFPNASPDFKAKNPEVFRVGGITADVKSASISPGDSWQDFEAEVIEWLHGNGFRVAHFRPAKTEKGWRTAVSADGKGFPDILALKEKLEIVIETKAGSGKASPDQVDWLLAFQRAGRPTFIVTPENWEKVKQHIEEL